jgi:uncharacterized metal-binding protein
MQGFIIAILSIIFGLSIGHDIVISTLSGVAIASILFMDLWERMKE